MLIFTGPVGRIVKGHVLDVAQKPLEEALRFYDPQLYVKWNPKKLKGHGSWELRRRPSEKSVVDFWEWPAKEGKPPLTILKIDWHENNVANHVKDFPYLNYGIVEWVKEHDTWNLGYSRDNVVAQAERNMDHHEKELQRQYAAQLRYDLKQHRKEWKDLKEFAASGGDLNDIASHWGK